MKKYTKLGLSAASLAIMLYACSGTKNSITVDTSLKKAYKNDFLIGTAMNSPQIEERDSLAYRLIKQQFNAATPENIMKAEIIHPAWDRYDFTLPDKLVEYGKKNN